MPDIVFAVPFIIIVTKNGYGSLRLCSDNHFARCRQLLADASGFSNSAVRQVMVIVQAMPVNFIAHRGCPPAEVEHHIGAMGNGLVRPEPHLSGFRRRHIHPVDPAAGT
ncbi:hypothetical protein D3C80_1600210 [compost metagenome]